MIVLCLAGKRQVLSHIYYRSAYQRMMKEYAQALSTINFTCQHLDDVAGRLYHGFSEPSGDYQRS